MSLQRFQMLQNKILTQLCMTAQLSPTEKNTKNNNNNNNERTTNAKRLVRTRAVTKLVKQQKQKQPEIK